MSAKKILFISLAILSLSLLLTGCGKNDVYMCPSGQLAGQQVITGNDVFICPDGSKATSMGGCSYPLKSSITKRDAEGNALNFIQGYVSANGWNPNIVNVNFVNGSYYAQVVVSKYEETPFETKLEIDGETGSVSCASGCSYIS